MKQFVIAGTLVGAVAFAGAAFAQTAPQTPPTAPAAKAQPKKAPAGDNSPGTHTAPKAQPNTAEDPTAPGAMALGTVRLPAGVKADGKDLSRLSRAELSQWTPYGHDRRSHAPCERQRGQ